MAEGSNNRNAQPSRLAEFRKLRSRVDELSFGFPRSLPFDALTLAGNKMLKEIHTHCETISKRQIEEEKLNKKILEKMEKNEEEQKKINTKIIEELESIRSDQKSIIDLVQKTKSDLDRSIDFLSEKFRFLKKIENLNKWAEPSKSTKILKFDTNWSDLSENLKRKCIDFLDIGSRLRLRSTSRTERLLVDSQIFEIDEMILFDNDHFMRLWKNSKCKSIPNKNLSEFSSNHSLQSIYFLGYCLKTSRINHLIINGSSKINKIVIDKLEIILEDQSIKCQNFSMKNGSSLKEFFLKKCWNNIGCIMFGEDESSIMDIIDIPAVTSAKHLQFAQNPGYINTCQLVQNYLIKRRSIGSGFRVQCTNRYLLDNLMFKFRNQIAPQSEYPQQARFVCSNFENHLLALWEPDFVLECVIIPAHLEKSEYQNFVVGYFF